MRIKEREEIRGMIRRLRTVRAISLQDIADTLNTEGVSPPSGKGRWHRSTVQRLDWEPYRGALQRSLERARLVLALAARGLDPDSVSQALLAAGHQPLARQRHPLGARPRRSSEVRIRLPKDFLHQAVMELYSRGWTLRPIAFALCISPNTAGRIIQPLVESHQNSRHTTIQKTTFR